MGDRWQVPGMFEEQQGGRGLQPWESREAGLAGGGQVQAARSEGCGFVGVMGGAASGF